MMACRRFVNAGIVTNFEMGWLREYPTRKRRKPNRHSKDQFEDYVLWSGVWSSVSDGDHPRTEADHQRRIDDDEQPTG